MSGSQKCSAPDEISAIGYHMLPSDARVVGVQIKCSQHNAARQFWDEELANFLITHIKKGLPNCVRSFTVYLNGKIYDVDRPQSE